LRLAERRAFGGRVVFEVPSAETVAESMQALGERPFDLVITDVFLSGGDRGTQLIMQMREDARLSSIPIIAISADEEIARHEAMRVGANVFLAKPVRLRQVARTVAELLDLSEFAWR
jgi:CheY-like chemotaxis protein